MYRSCQLAVAAVLLCACWIQAAVPTYTLTDLGTITGSESEGYAATGLNAFGQVSGGYGGHAFLWTPTAPNATTGTMKDLGNLPTATSSVANGINDYGQVSGQSLASDKPRAFLWTPTAPNQSTGSMKDISRPTGSGDEADHINASGQVVGLTAGGSQEYLWTPTTPNGTTGSMTLLGTLPGTEESFPGKINTRGQVPGSSYGFPTDNLYHANLWSPTTPNGTTGSMIDLTDLPGGSNQSFADSVNDAGKVVGAGTTAAAKHATLWTPTTPNGTTGSLLDLQSLLNVNNDSEAYDINSSDQIVGFSEIANNVNRATIWTSGGPVDLNTLITGPNPGWVLSGAFDINDAGQIVCNGSLGSTQHAILLTPTGLPEPATISLLAFALLASQRRGV